MKKFFFNSYNFLLIVNGSVFITNLFLSKSIIQEIVNISAPIVLIIYALIVIKFNKTSNHK